MIRLSFFVQKVTRSKGFRIKSASCSFSTLEVWTEELLILYKENGRINSIRIIVFI